MRLLFLMIMTAFSFMALPAKALEILSGEVIQGGLVLLKAEPGSLLSLDGEPLMVTEDGIAVIGFHRDDTAAVTVTATAKTGRVTSQQFTPKLREYEEQRIEGLPPKMVTPPEEVLARIKRDRAMVVMARSAATPLDHFTGSFDWPSKGIITGIYGSRRILNGEPRAPHYGIDIAAPEGSPVIAPQGGIIRMVADLYFTGWTIILDHGHGVNSTFLHLKDTSVIPGDRVEKGQLLGHVGSTGRSTGPHLDWRVNLFGKRLDPQLLAGPMPQ
jgi:murein DD-endopeptidase MepM/ murein hydrolase activator NlpD